MAFGPGSEDYEAPNDFWGGVDPAQSNIEKIQVRAKDGSVRWIPMSEVNKPGVIQPGETLTQEGVANLNKYIGGSDQFFAGGPQGYTNAPQGGLGLQGQVAEGRLPWRQDPQTGQYSYDQSAATQGTGWSDPNGGFGGFVKEAAASPSMQAMLALITAGQTGVFGPGTQPFPGMFGAPSAGTSAVSNYAAPANTFGGFSATNGLGYSGELAGLGEAGALEAATTGGGAFGSVVPGTVGAGGITHAPFTELGRQAGFTDTLRNVGLGQALSTGLPASIGGALGIKSLIDPKTYEGNGGAGGAGGLGGLVGQAGGLGSLANLLGVAGTTGLGVYEANQASKAAEERLAFDRERYANEQSAIAPYRANALDLLQNPDKAFERPDIMAGTNAVLRGLSADVGNPYNNRTAIDKASAYTYGNYGNLLNSAVGNAGLGNATTLAGLGNQVGGSMGNLSNAERGVPASLGWGLGSLLSRPSNPYLNYSA